MIAGLAITYHQTGARTTYSIVLWPAGLFVMETGNASVPLREEVNIGHIFYVYSNMTDIHIRGSFTSNQSVTLSIGYIGEKVTGMGLPTIEKLDYSSGNTTASSFSVSIPSNPNVKAEESYTIIFSEAHITATEVNVTSAIVLSYQIS